MLSFVDVRVDPNGMSQDELWEAWEEEANEALAAKEAGEPRVVLFNLSGHGHFDLSAYDRYFAGELEDFAYPSALVKEAMGRVPVVA